MVRGLRAITRAITTPTVALVFALLVSGVGADSAHALVVQLSNGHAVGITPRAGVAPASIPGVRASKARPNVVDNGNVNYHAGPVVHSSTPYLIFWGPSGSFSASTQALMIRYFSDVAQDSGSSTNVYGVVRQYTDATGFADYQQTFSASAQVITDTDPYPARDTSGCPNANVNATYYPTCITDAQLQSELTTLIGADQLPTDGSTSTGALVDNAPIYFIVTPASVNICAPGLGCADSTFCAYHSNYTEAGSYVLYAAIDLLNAENSDQSLNPKFCQADGNSVVQKPNLDRGDVAIKYMSHENSETITDPLLNAWYDSISGNEVGDNCNITGPVNFTTGTDPNAFLPTLGGAAASGTLYDQLINADKYYIQSEWSNGDINCEMQPTAAALSASFTAPSGSPSSIDSPVSFDPGASSSAAGYSSVSWSFGDGAASFARGPAAPAPVSHTYTTPGTYTVKLTLVDVHGNVSVASQDVIIVGPTAAFSFSPTVALVGQSVMFDGTGSSDSKSGGTLTSYSWDFGDLTTGTGTTASHTYTSPGVYTVTLTVTDNLGLVSSAATKQIYVLGPPTAAFTSSAPSLPGSSVAFDASGSTDPNNSPVNSYAWSFGDGATATGETTSHAYASPGLYTVRLTVRDSLGLVSAPMSEQVEVLGPPTAAFAFTPTAPLSGGAVAFDGSSSSDQNSGGQVDSYSWSFGDGTAATGAAPSHTYASPGVYTVTLTVTDNFGVAGIPVSQQILVLGAPSAAFAFLPAAPLSGRAVNFAATASDPNSGGRLSSYSWSFGDGTAGTGPTPSHAYASPGTYTVQLTVTDNFGLSSSASRVIDVIAPGTPTVSRASLSLGRRAPKLTFVLTAGNNAPKLRQVVIALPSSLRFVKKGLAKGVAVVGVDGSRLSFGDKLSNGRLMITLNGGAGAIKVTVAGPAISVPRTRPRTAARGRGKSLKVALTAIDLAGRQTALTLKFRVQ